MDSRVGGSSSPNEAEYEVQNILVGREKSKSVGSVQKCHKSSKLSEIGMMRDHI